MNNAEVQLHLRNCKSELTHVSAAIGALGPLSPVAPYLTKYAVIRACGAIEVSFKALIFDYCAYRSKSQVKRFLQRRIRDGSANPSFDNIVKFLKEFDEGWKINFKAKIDAKASKAVLLTSLQSLVDARNEFAHGGDPSLTIGDVVSHFDNASEIIELMDDVIG